MQDSRNYLSMRRRNAPLQGRNPAQSAFTLAILTQIMLQGILSTTSVFCALRRSAFYCPLSSYPVASRRLATLKSYLTHATVSFKGSTFCLQTNLSHCSTLFSSPRAELLCGQQFILLQLRDRRALCGCVCTQARTHARVGVSACARWHQSADRLSPAAVS